MSGVRLVLRATPALRVDARGITPAAVAGLAVAAVERLTVGHGNRLVPIAELFDVQDAVDADGVDLRFEGDLAKVDRIGWQSAAGRVVAHGPVGDYAGGGMTGGELHVKGDAGALAACEMAGGLLRIDGSVGDFAASTLPGSMDGMRGGTLVVHGDAGDRFADRMRRGSALVFGDCGDFLASRLVAGSIAVGGAVGAHVGYGMRRGSVVLANAGIDPSVVAPTFVPAQVDPVVFWQLLARDLARHGGPFAGLPTRRIERHLGDTAAGGKGEIIFPR